MKDFYPFLALCILLISSSVIQAQVKLALIDNKYAERFEIYAMHEDLEFSSSKTFIGTGQVTLVVDAGNELSNITNYNGIWVMNAKAAAPTENPTKDYFSFGFSDYTQVDISGTIPTLLFSIEYSNEGESNIVDDNDPFLQLPNSLGTNPGNELSIAWMDGEMVLMNYSSNYEPCNPSPLPCELSNYNLAKLGKKNKAIQNTANRNSETIMAAKNKTNTP